MVFGANERCGISSTGDKCELCDEGAAEDIGISCCIVLSLLLIEEDYWYDWRH